MAEQELDRNLDATPHKLEEAKRQGNVAKSMDLGAWLSIACALVAVAMFTSAAADHVIKFAIACFVGSSHWGDAVGWAPHLEQIFISLAGTVMGPTLFLLCVVAIVSSILQTGPIFSAHPLRFDWSRLNIVTGLQKLFSMRILFELFKTLVKIVLAVAVAVCYWVAKAWFNELLGLTNAEVGRISAYLRDQLPLLIFYFLLALSIVVAIDLLFTRREYMQKMRMSKREMKDETRRREGDPQLRAKLKEQQRELLKRSRSLGRVKDADVIITNPTHLAVAISYKRNVMTSPAVLAKGAGEMAQRIIILARKHRIPIIEHKPLARNLFRHAELDKAVPDETFPRLARILAWVYGYRRDLPEGVLR